MWRIGKIKLALAGVVLAGVAAGGLVIASSAQAALPVGAHAPDFTTRGALAGKVFTFSLADALKKGPVVLYFFPAAFTPGCTAEAHDFAEATAQFAKEGATVVGMSADPVDKLAKFSTEACRNKFAVASAGPAVIKEYQVLSNLPFLKGRTDRTSYVIAPTGRISYVYSSLNPAEHVKNTLAAVQSLETKK